jgi:hypothetical protein
MQYLFFLEFSQKKSANVELYSVSNISLIMFSKSNNILLIIVNKVCLDSGSKNQFEGFGPTREYDIKIYFKKIAPEDVLVWFRI